MQNRQNSFEKKKQKHNDVEEIRHSNVGVASYKKYFPNIFSQLAKYPEIQDTVFMTKTYDFSRNHFVSLV